ncbi:MAG TPA: RES domain-containing protein [Gammaproteobacteria bacterium]|nr:RES domain-containing protein [Gammaproteobacteria bacterium]
MDELYYIESLTNERLRHEAGDIAMVPTEDRISGPGSSAIMAAFTHISINRPSRFSNGSYGVYYAAKSLATAIEETKFHRAIFLAYTNEEPGEIDMRVYIGEVLKPMHDIRIKGYESLHNPDDWTPGQAFGQKMHESSSWGLVYNSVRDQGGQCIAVFRAPGISIPVQGAHLSYVWNGSTITDVFEKNRLE